MQARASLEKSALAMIGDTDYLAEGKSDLQLRTDALAAREKFEFDVKKHDSRYVEVRFDSALMYFEKEDDPYKDYAPASPQARTDSKSTERSSYQNMIERNKKLSAPDGEE